MAYGKANENGELIVNKYEGLKPIGVISNKNSTGSFTSSMNCNGTWSVSTN
jgi:hypothetical protein